jgi:hypothetical protein
MEAKLNTGSNTKKDNGSGMPTGTVQEAVYEAPTATFVAVVKEERLTGCGDSETLCTTTYHS